MYGARSKTLFAEASRLEGADANPGRQPENAVSKRRRKWFQHVMGLPEILYRMP
jgi:hypothetical protein